jgi:hypothetical protein
MVRRQVLLWWLLKKDKKELHTGQYGSGMRVGPVSLQTWGLNQPCL